MQIRTGRWLRFPEFAHDWRFGVLVTMGEECIDSTKDVIPHLRLHILDKKPINQISLITKKFFDDLAASETDLLPESLKNGVDAIVYFRLHFDRQVMEFRSGSDEYDMSKIAMVFNGGGHVRAAGCPFSGYKYCIKNN